MQAVVVATLLLGLAAGTWALVNPIFGALQGAGAEFTNSSGSCHSHPRYPRAQSLKGTLPEGWFKTWRKTWPILGAFYMAAGSCNDREIRYSAVCHDLNARDV